MTVNVSEAMLVYLDNEARTRGRLSMCNCNA